MESASITDDYLNLLDDMTQSMSSARGVLKSLRKSNTELDTKDGISLLSLKHHILLSYLQGLTLVTSRRALGESLLSRSNAVHAFASEDRPKRGPNLGDTVDSMIEQRVVLEKIKTVELRMRYQIEKLVRIAEDADKSNVVDDPLAFRPNPQNLAIQDQSRASDGRPKFTEEQTDPTDQEDGLYHPPRLAPVPYIEKSKSQGRKDRAPLPSALATLGADPARPHLESTSGLGSTPSLASGRAAHLKRLTEFEEAYFSRVIMKKSEAKRRARDEADIALGGDLGGGSSGRRRRAGGLEDEFGDILRSVGRGTTSTIDPTGEKGDGYDELRKKSKRQDVLGRSRAPEKVSRVRDEDGDHQGAESGRMRKRSRFTRAVRGVKRAGRKR